MGALDAAMRMVSCRLGSLVAFCVAFIPMTIDAAGQPLREYDVKAAFVFNFLSFVEWPETAFNSPDEPFVIGVMARGNPFEGTLQEILSGERVGQHPCVVRQIERIEEIQACDLLFIARSERHRVDSILEASKGRPILTVADFHGFAERGGMIELRNQDQRVKLHINRRSAAKAGMAIDSQLLRLAHIVGEEVPP